MPVIIKNLYDNPFITAPIIPNEYFCDRETETARLLGYIANGNNVVLKSSRRIGKTSLIRHLFQQETIEKNYNTVLVDLYQTKNLQGLVTRFSRALLNSSFAKTESGKKSLSEAIPEIKLYAQLKAGPLTAGMEAIYYNRYEETLDHIFDFLKKTDRRNLVVFDEFQTIEKYKEEQVPAVLRTNIQQQSNTNFIFSGSERHMLASMFQDSNKPFYKSSMQMEIDIIPYPSYRDFCKRMFEIKGKEITEDAIKLTYNVFMANTYEMQQVMNQTFSLTAKKADRELVKLAIFHLMTENESNYRDIFNKTKNEKEYNFLLCIGKEGIASGLTSTQMINEYALGSASAVQNCIKKYSSDEKPVIEEIGRNNYRLQEKLFELWIADNMDSLENKYELAEEQFKKERDLIKDKPKFQIKNGIR